MRKLTRHLSAAVAACVLALAMSGCVIIKSQSSTQLDEIGSVQITTAACASDTNSNNTGYNPADPACQGAGKGGNANIDAVNDQVQLLVGYRIPSAIAPPSAFTSTNPGGAGAISFSQSPTYTAELQSLSPAPTGQKWAGYISSNQTYTTAGNQYFTLATRFGLPQGEDGSPFQGPFNYRVVVGERTNGSYPASRPVDCGSSITSLNTSDDTICADSPSAATISTSDQLPTKDLGILEAPGVQSVEQGHVARVKFQAVYASDGNPAPTFLLEASTNIPGATAAPSTPVLTPEEGTNQLRAIVRPPVDTATGLYDVTLTATSPGGEIRSSTHEVLVTPTTVRCTEVAPTIAGTRGDDLLIGTPGRDVIAGYLGNDRIVSLEGNDLVCAGRGDDTLLGGGGNDQLAGRRGNDQISGGGGHDVIRFGPGKNRLIRN